MGIGIIKAVKTIKAMEAMKEFMDRKPGSNCH